MPQVLLCSLDRGEICAKSEDVIAGIFGGRVEIWTAGSSNNGGKVLQRGKERLPFGRGIVGHVAEVRMTVNIPDAYCDRRYDPAHDRERGLTTRSVLSTPVLAQGHLHAVLQAANRIVDGDVAAFSAQDEGLLTLLASHVAQALANAAQHQRQVDTEAGSRVLMHAILKVAVQPDWKLCIAAILETACKMLASPCSSLYLRDEWGSLVKYTHLHAEEELRSEGCTLGEGIGGGVALSAHAVRAPDAWSHPDFQMEADSHPGLAEPGCVLCVPLVTPSGLDVMGSIQV